MSARKRPAPPQDQPFPHHQTNRYHQSSGWERRRDAAARSVPLDCGCRDPWVHRCAPEPDPTERTTEAAVHASHHLLDHGLPPLFSIATCRALWRAGHRELATRCAPQLAEAVR